MCPWIDVKNLKHFRNLNSYSLTYFHVYLYTYVIQIINSIHKNITLHQRVWSLLYNILQYIGISVKPLEELTKSLYPSWRNQITGENFPSQTHTI